jgi:chromosome segregation ATPase
MVMMNKFLVLVLVLFVLIVPVVDGGILSFLKNIFRHNRSSKVKNENSYNYDYNELLNEIRELKESNYILTCQVTSLKNRLSQVKKEKDTLRSDFIKLKEKHNIDIKEITNAIVKKLEDENNDRMAVVRQKYEQELSVQRNEVEKIKKDFADKANTNALKAKAEIKRLMQTKEQTENELVKVKEQLLSTKEQNNKRRVSINRVRLSKEEKYSNEDEDDEDDNDSEDRPRSWSYSSKPPSKKFVVKRGRGIRR